jgi:hypothetical protein
MAAVIRAHGSVTAMNARINRLTSLIDMDFPFSFVRVAGFEPAWISPADFESAVYTDSTTLAK